MVNIDLYKLELENEIEERISPIMKEKFLGLSFNYSRDVEFPKNMYQSQDEVIQAKTEHWCNQFNMKALQTEYNYGYMLMYYHSLQGEDVFRNFTPENLGTHYWFSYEAESLLNRLYTSIDYIYHIINEKFSINAPTNSRFRRSLLSSLTEVQPELSAFLTAIVEGDRFVKFRELRNDFMHNHSPLYLTPGLNIDANGVTTISSGEYIKPYEIVNAVDNFIGLLHELVIEVKKYI